MQAVDELNTAKEPVSLGIHLVSPVVHEGGSDDAMVVGQDLGVGLRSQPSEQQSGAFDVPEQERDRP